MRSAGTELCARSPPPFKKPGAEAKTFTLGIIPLGTGNLLARNLRLPITDIAACINIALNGTHQLVDAIDMSAESAEGRRYQPYVLRDERCGV